MSDAPTLGKPLNVALAQEAAMMPAIYANKAQVELTESLQIRLSFAEQNPNAGVVLGRACVIVSAETASGLAELINKLVQKVNVLSALQ